MAQALSFLHTRKPMILHLDLKPGNVLLTNDLTTIKLCDFGISKATEKTRTTMTHVVGTPLYMCEQQFKAGEQMDPRFDIYSFGAVLSFMLSGVPPYNNSLSSYLGADGKVVPLVELFKPRKDCPAFLVKICKDCLVVDPELRPKNGEILFKMIMDGLQTYSPSMFQHASMMMMQQQQMSSGSGSSGGTTDSSPQSDAYSRRSTSNITTGSNGLITQVITFDNISLG
jgi:serine/threonine protein kinase